MNESTTPRKVYLSPDVYAAVIASQLIFLDLNKDSYATVGLDGEGGAIDARVALTLARQFEVLKQAALVTDDSTRGRAFVCTEAVAPGCHVFAPEDGRPFGLTGELPGSGRISAEDVRAFFSAFLHASHRLRRRHIAEAVAEVRSIQQRLVDISRNEQRLRREVAVFSRLRPWFPARYVCLQDSLALAFFLLRRGVPCEWVFAVQTHPFGAHCWLESDGVVLNDSLEYARQFVPIMRVQGNVAV